MKGMSRETKRRCVLALAAACCLAAALLLRSAALWGAPGMDPQHQTVPSMTPKGPAPTEPGGDDEEQPGPGTPTHPSLAPTSSPQPTAPPSGTPLSPTTASPSAVIGAASPSTGWDFGDAPDPGFPSLLASEGARHLTVHLEWLGEGVHQELDSQQVDADLYDDGVSPGELTTCQEADVQVKVSVVNRDDPQHPCDGQHLLYLNALVDWDGNGSWAGTASCPERLVAPEWAIRNLPVDVSAWPPGVTSTVVPLEFMVGAQAGETWARFTLSYRQVISGDDWDGRGAFTFGETEDYALTIRPSGETATYTASATSGPTATPTSRVVAAASPPAGISGPQSSLWPVAGLALGSGIGAIWIARRRRRAGQ